MKPFLSVVVPFLNEEGNLGPLYERLRPVLQAEASRYEILFVDDGSSDGSVRRVRELQAQDPSVKLIVLARNYGHQLALTAGLDHATGDAVLTLDADLQHPPELIPRFLEEWRRGADVVHGVKTGRARGGLLKRAFASAYYRLMRWIARVEIVPHASDYRLLSRTAAAALRSMRERSRFLRGLVNWMGFPTARVAYEPDERRSGRPKYTFRRSAGLGLSGVLSFSTFPLRLSTYAGLAIGALSLAYAGFALHARLFRGAVIEGWTSMIVAVLFLGSTQLLALGVLGEYLARVFDEVKARPLYLVREAPGSDAGTPKAGP